MHAYTKIGVSVLDSETSLGELWEGLIQVWYEDEGHIYEFDDRSEVEEAD